MWITFRSKSRQCRPPKHDDAQSGRIHPPLPAPRSAEGLPPHPSLRLPRQRRPQRQCRACPGVARCACTGRGRGRRVATRPASAMPLLRRPYGHHRDLPACGSGTRATIVTSRHRDHGVMIQHDEPQPPAEAAALQPAVRHAPASITNALTATMTAGSRCPSTARGTIVALAHRDHHRAAPLNRVAQSPRRLNRSTRILKSP